MTPGQIDLVKNSWRKTDPAAPVVAELFYRKLFEINPTLKTMFCNDMQAQYQKLSDTLTVIIEHLDNPVALLPKIQTLGMQHSGYGVQDEHYEMVEQALLWALRQSLGEDFDTATEQAWQQAYRSLADAMMAADIDDMMYPC